MSELLPCPFCGTEGSVWSREGRELVWVAGCHQDGCVADYPGTEFRSEADAIAAWNRRAPSPHRVLREEEQ